MTPQLQMIATLLFLINAGTFLYYGWDKKCAVEGCWRVPEANLLTVAMLGGSPAALLACHVFRHKTRKQPFATVLHVIIVVQVGLLIGFLA